jgi:hypothetical protein
MMEDNPSYTGGLTAQTAFFPVYTQVVSDSGNYAPVGRGGIRYETALATGRANDYA